LIAAKMAPAGGANCMRVARPRPAAAAILLLALLAPLARAQSAATPLVASAHLVFHTTAEFRLGGLPVKLGARTTIDWHCDGAGYGAHLHMDTGGFDQDSQGVYGPQGVLAPTRYTEKRPFHEPESVAIDWQARQIRFGGAAGPAPPVTGAQDRISLPFELARERLSEPGRFAPGSAHDVRLIGTHDVDPWTFNVAAEETVETGRGPMRAVRYSASRSVNGAVETMDIWLGAELHWLPVRIRMVDRHQSVIDSVLQSSELP
jgi:hypothetical protein